MVIASACRGGAGPRQSSRSSSRASVGQPGDRPAGMPEQLVRHGLRRDDGVAPRVRGDPLGEQLGADPVGLAADRVDPQAVAHGARAGVSGLRQYRQPPGLRARPRRGVPAQVVAEHAERAGRQRGGPVREVAGAAPGDQGEQLPRPVQRVAGLAGRRRPRRTRRPARAARSGTDRTGRRSGWPGSRSSRAVSARPQADSGSSDEDARPERRPGRPQAGVGHPDVQRGRVAAASRRSSRRPARPAAARPTRPRVPAGRRSGCRARFPARSARVPRR